MDLCFLRRPALCSMGEAAPLSNDLRGGARWGYPGLSEMMGNRKSDLAASRRRASGRCGSREEFQ